MKEFFIIIAGCTVLAYGMVYLASGAGSYYVRIECSNCRDVVARAKLKRGEPVPPGLLKCDDCGNMTGTLRR